VHACVCVCVPACVCVSVCVCVVCVNEKLRVDVLGPRFGADAHKGRDAGDKLTV